MTNRHLIYFQINKKVGDSDCSYRGDQILKTSASEQEKYGQQIIQDYIQSSKIRLQTSQFIEKRGKSHSNALKNILSTDSSQYPQEQFPKFFSPKQNKYNQPFEKLLKSENNISRRLQILEIEKLFTSKISKETRNESVMKMEQFIRELLFEEQRELSYLFNTFMQEVKHDLAEQSVLMMQNQKQLESKLLDSSNKQNKLFNEKQTQYENRIQQLQMDISNLKFDKAKLEKDITELITRNSILITKVEQRNKIINFNEKTIKQNQAEIQIFKQKIACYENKLQQSMETIFQLNRQQVNVINQTSPSSIKNDIQEELQDEIYSNSDSSKFIDQADQKEVEQLNQIEINYERIIVQCQKETQIEADLLPFYTKEKETQTNFNMIDKKYDVLTQLNLNNAISYTEFIEQIGKKNSEDCLVDQIIDEAFEQIDTQASAAGRRCSELNKSGMSMKKSGNSVQSQDRQIQTQIPIITRCDSTIISNNLLIPPSTPATRKETKVKQILSFINFQKIRIQQLEKDYHSATDQINILEQTTKSQSQQNQELTSENEKLNAQITEMQNNWIQSKSQIDIKPDEEIPTVHQSQDSYPAINQKRISILLKQQTFKENKKQRKGPQLGQKVVVSYDFQKDQSKKLIEKIKSKQNQKFQNFMPLKLVLKYITTLYQEKLQSQKEQKIVKDQDMAAYIYNYYLSQYGYTKLTEQKFMVLVLSIKKNLKIIRVNIFAKFMGLLESNVNYTVEELQKYLEAVEYMNNQQNLGASIKENESDIKQYVPYVRALSYIGNLIFSQTNEEQSQLKHEIELLKEQDPKNINKQGIIDFDLMMIKVLQVFRNNVEKTKLYVINAFAASDLDGNGMCNLDEFLILNKYIEPDKYDEEKWIDVFEDNADLITEEEKNLSFDRFSILCMEYNLFSDQAQNKFLQIKNNGDTVLKFEQLKQQWTSDFIYFNEKLQNANIDEQLKEQWMKILTVLNQKILEDPQQVKPLLIAHKIFLNESRVLKS